MNALKSYQAIKKTNKNEMQYGRFFSSFPNYIAIPNPIRQKNEESNINFIDIKHLDIPEDHNAHLFAEWNY